MSEDCGDFMDMKPDEHLQLQAKSLTPCDLALSNKHLTMLEIFEIVSHWQSPPSDDTDLDIRAFCRVVNDLILAAEKREGVRTMRTNYKIMLDAKHKLDKLFCDLGPFAMEK